ncbi:MAG: hypothetical protein M1826_002040 [Phylliscum demangeonii]|nr:MAG: hypothetical protein M1826_002040 [Phylliscum demangeonii]
MSPVSQADPDSHEPNGASAGATSSPERALQTARKRRKVNLVVDYNKWSLGAQNQFQDMHTFDPFIFNSPQVTEEYNLLNTFLKETSLLDEEAVFLRDDNRDPNDGGDAIDPFPAHHLKDGVSPAAPNPDPNRHLLPAPIDLGPENVISRPASVKPTDDARETYYLTAADPSGSDPPEERMKKLLRAKYEAGLLKPFNYLKGYARLSRYMERNMRAPSRQKILRQLDKFRPIFRERMQALTDMELVLVEMWFERSLMEYDRVFASMAIPACCWRRTGEIYRGNKEMAELIHAPIEQLRDVRDGWPPLGTITVADSVPAQGKVAIHEVFEEDSLVGYWEKFGTIAFDKAQKAMLTSCMLKSPDPKSTARHIHCCFSFTIRRDSHDIPSLIVGNFLPMDIP